MELSPEGLQLILDGEVGGGRPYYERFCLHPVVPGGPDTQSGVTIGIGFDLGQCSIQAFTAVWGDYLSGEIMARLTTVVGLRGKEAKGALARVRDISIPWETALDQSLARSVSRYWSMTEAAFPGIETAPRCVREGLLSLVYNRGTSMDGDRRRAHRTRAAAGDPGLARLFAREIGMSFLAALPIVGKVVSQIVGVIDQAVEDKDQAAKLKQEVQMALIRQDFSFVEEELKARAQVISTEAQGASFLQRNWRPILMLTFTYIVAHNYVFSPLFSLPRLDIPPDMWELLKLGMGGYILDRSAEKAVEAWKKG